MFYETYLTSDFHTNTVSYCYFKSVCLLVKMALKTVIRPIGPLSSHIYNYTRFFLRRNQRLFYINFSFKKVFCVFFFLFSLRKRDNCVILRNQTHALETDQISPM